MSSPTTTIINIALPNWLWFMIIYTAAFLKLVCQRLPLRHQRQAQPGHILMICFVSFIVILVSRCTLQQTYFDRRDHVRHRNIERWPHSICTTPSKPAELLPTGCPLKLGVDLKLRAGGARLCELDSVECKLRNDITSFRASGGRPRLVATTRSSGHHSPTTTFLKNIRLSQSKQLASEMYEHAIILQRSPSLDWSMSITRLYYLLIHFRTSIVKPIHVLVNRSV